MGSALFDLFNNSRTLADKPAPKPPAAISTPQGSSLFDLFQGRGGSLNPPSTYAPTGTGQITPMELYNQAPAPQNTYSPGNVVDVGSQPQQGPSFNPLQGNDLAAMLAYQEGVGGSAPIEYLRNLLGNSLNTYVNQYGVGGSQYMKNPLNEGTLGPYWGAYQQYRGPGGGAYTPGVGAAPAPSTAAPPPPAPATTAPAAPTPGLPAVAPLPKPGIAPVALMGHAPALNYAETQGSTSPMTAPSPAGITGNAPNWGSALTGPAPSTGVNRVAGSMMPQTPQQQSSLQPGGYTSPGTPLAGAPRYKPAGVR